MIGQIAKRVAFVVLGYFAGLAAGAAAFPGIIAIISSFNPASQLWQVMGFAPVAILVEPGGENAHEPCTGFLRTR